MLETAREAGKTVPKVQSAAGAKGERTRMRILDCAYDAIIHKGFAGTSIEELVAAAGITKSGFFYHFRDKSDLARQLLERFLAEDDAIMDQMTARAKELVEDPLQQFLLFLKLYAEAADAMEELHPGCLVAAVVYQDQAFDREIMRLNSEGVLRWRERFISWLEPIDAMYPAVSQVDRATLADGLTVVVEGSIVLAKALNDPRLIGRQLRMFRELVRMTYAARAA